MKNNQISPVQIPHLVSLTADIFSTLNNGIDYSQQKSVQVHFAVDLLKELAEVAYPIENETKKTHIKVEHLINASLEDFLNNEVVGRKPKSPTKPEGPPCRKLGEF